MNSTASYSITYCYLEYLRSSDADHKAKHMLVEIIFEKRT